MRQRGEHSQVVFEDSILAAKAMRGRIALQKHCVQNPTRQSIRFCESFGSAARPRVGFAHANLAKEALTPQLMVW